MFVLSEINHLSNKLVLLLEAHYAYLHQARELLSALIAGAGTAMQCQGMLFKPVCSLHFASVFSQQGVVMSVSSVYSASEIFLGYCS